MKIDRVKKIIPILVAFVAIVFGWMSDFLSGEEPVKQQSIFPLSDPYYEEVGSSVGDDDDPNARFNYHINLQVDPSTGHIPWGIYQLEKEYIKTLPKRQTFSGTTDFNLRTRQEEWKSVGPRNAGGRTRAFKVDVTDNNILVAGSVSGSMWRSEDTGQSWSITSDPNSMVGVTALAQDTRPGNENIWYYGTGEIRGNSARAPGAPYRGDGIYKSVDGARSWEQLSSTQVPIRDRFNSQFNYIYRIVTNHTRLDADEVYAAAYGGVLRSEDGGETWSAVLGDQLFGLPDDADLNGTISPFFTEVVISPNGVLYAYLSEEISLGFYNPAGRGVFRSTNGTDWQNITPPTLPDSANRAVIAIAPSNEDLVYLFVDHGARASKRHSLWTYNHQDPVGQWTDLSDNVPAFGGDFGDMDTQNSYNMVMEVHPNDEDIVFIGGTNLYRSLDGFRTSENTTWIAGYDDANNGLQWPQHHADQHGLFFLPDPPFRLYSTHDAGLSFTNGSTLEEPQWISLNNGYVTSQFYAIDLQQDEASDIIAGGTQDNGSWFGIEDELSGWNRLSGGDGAYSAIGERARFLYSSSQNGRIFRIIIDFEAARITSRSRIDPVGGGQTEGQGYLFINPFILDPNDTERMYVAGGDVIWRNQNVLQIPAGRQEQATNGWETLESTTLLDSGQITTLVASIDIPNRLYFGTSDGRLYKVDSAHITDGITTNITSPLFPKDAYLINVNLNPENADELIVVFSSYMVQSIFHSVNGGATFNVIAGNLEEFEDGTGSGPSIRWGNIVPMDNGTNRYYVGTSSGLFSTGQLQGNQTEWQREGPETIGQSIVTMIRYRPLDGRMAVATHGNGVFTTNISGFKQILPPNLESLALEITNSFPNPFNETVTIEYNIPAEDIVLARIFDLSGNWVKTALFGTQLPGTNRLTWDGTNNLGDPVPSGIYVLHVLYDGKNRSSRLILNR